MHEIIPDSAIPAADPEAMVEQYRKWVYRIANRYQSFLSQTGRIDIDDLIQCGYMGLLEAQKTYHPENSTFLFWSGLYIKKNIRNALGLKNDGSLPEDFELISIDEPIPQSNGKPINLLDVVPDPRPSREEELIEEAGKQEIKKAVHEAVDRLKNEKQREVIKRVWLDGQTRKKAAIEMNISTVSLRGIDLAARKKLANDRRLKKIFFPLYYVSVKRFNSTMASATEAAVLWREMKYDKIFGNGEFLRTKDI